MIDRDIKQLLITQFEILFADYVKQKDIINYDAIQSKNKNLKVILVKSKNEHNDGCSVSLYILTNINKKLTITAQQINLFNYIDIKLSNHNKIIITDDESKIIVSCCHTNTVKVFSLNEHKNIIKENIITGYKLGDLFGYSLVSNRDGSVILIGSPFTSLKNSVDNGVVFVYKYNKEGMFYEEIKILTSKYFSERKLVGNKLSKEDHIYQNGQERYFVENSYFRDRLIMTNDGEIIEIYDDIDGKLITVNLNEIEI